MLSKRVLVIVTSLIVAALLVFAGERFLLNDSYSGNDGEECYKSLSTTYVNLRKVVFLDDKAALSKLIYKFERSKDVADSEDGAKQTVSGTLVMKNLGDYVKNNDEYPIAQPKSLKKMLERVGKVSRYGYLCYDKTARFTLSTDADFGDEGTRMMRYELNFRWQDNAWKLVSGQQFENIEEYRDLLIHIDAGLTWVPADAEKDDEPPGLQ